MKKLSACIAAFVCASTSLSAGEAAIPPAGLDKLSLFEGARNCTGKLFADPAKPEQAIVGIANGEKAVGDHWIHFAYDETKTATRPAPYHFGAFMGFDAARKMYVQAGVDASGYQISTSPGWSGDTLTFEGSQDVKGKPTLQRDNFVRKGALGFTHFGETQNADGKWVKTDEETCNPAQ